MRELIVSEAPLPRIAQLAKEVVEDQGGVVSQHTHQSTCFDHMRLDRDAWSRSGYLGTYQPFQGKQVRVRVRVWAAWPKRLFRAFVWLGLVQALVYFSMSLFQSPPAPNVWIWSAIFTFAGLGITLLLYSSSWSSSADVEERIVRNLGAEIREDSEVPGSVYTPGGWKEHRAELVEQAVAHAPAAKATTHERQGVRSRLERLRPKRAPKGQDAAVDGTDDEPDEADAPKGKRRLGLRRRRKASADEPGPPSEEASEPANDGADEEE